MEWNGGPEHQHGHQGVQPLKLCALHPIDFCEMRSGFFADMYPALDASVTAAIGDHLEDIGVLVDGNINPAKLPSSINFTGVLTARKFISNGGTQPNEHRTNAQNDQVYVAGQVGTGNNQFRTNAQNDERYMKKLKGYDVENGDLTPEVGAYALLFCQQAFSAGQELSGTNLYRAGFSTSTDGSFPVSDIPFAINGVFNNTPHLGTWRAMSQSQNNPNNDRRRIGLFLRIQ